MSQSTGVDAHPPIPFGPDRGPPSSPDGRAELVKLATRLIIEETLEAEARDLLVRDYYEHGAEPGSGYRNGVRTRRRGATPPIIQQTSDLTVEE